MTTHTAARMGRPRGFAEDIALEAAMRVFWEKGYEGATLADLTEAMGINRSSLYASFGDKEAIFRMAMARYAEGPAAYLKKALQEPTVRTVVEALLHGALAGCGKNELSSLIPLR
jgi:AcrR family transcriptional regulator